MLWRIAIMSESQSEKEDIRQGTMSQEGHLGVQTV